MAAPAPISGNYFVSVGYTTTLSCTTTGGTWSSGNAAVATVDTNGVVTGKDAGAVIISYTNTDGAATFPLNVQEIMVTNGFNLDRLMPAMATRLGWLQTSTAGIPALSVVNMQSASGRYYNDFHESCTLKNIYDLQEDSTQNNADEFNAVLQNYNRKVLLRTVNAIFNKPPLIEHKLCYNRNYNLLPVAIPNNGKFVGYRVVVAPGNYAVVFNAISLFFNGVGTFNIYLFDDLVKAPLRTKSVTTEATSQTKVQLNWTVNYNAGTNGGVFFIGYFQNDTNTAGIQALDEQLTLWNKSIVFGGTPFEANSIGETDFDRRNPNVNFYSYGLNLEISSYRDYTQVLIENAHLFDEPRGLTMGITVIEAMKNSTRTNTTQVQMQAILQRFEYDLNGSIPDGQGSPYVAGLRKQLQRALESINSVFVKKQEAISVTIIDAGTERDSAYQGIDLQNLPPREALTQVF